MNVASRLCLLSCIALLPCLAQAASTPDKRVKGLPPGGTIDQQAVIASHYASAAGAPAPPAHAKRAAPAVPAGGITYVTFDGTGGQAQADVPITFGQVFARGDLKPAQALVGRFADGSSIPLQVDVKATHADGSVRHAILSLILPQLPAGASLTMAIAKADTTHAVPASRRRSKGS